MQVAWLLGVGDCCERTVAGEAVTLLLSVQTVPQVGCVEAASDRWIHADVRREVMTRYCAGLA